MLSKGALAVDVPFFKDLKLASINRIAPSIEYIIGDISEVTEPLSSFNTKASFKFPSVAESTKMSPNAPIS